jgi:hypothetical protein
MKFLFLPSIKTVDQMNTNYSTRDISTEQMVYSGDWNFTYENGGKITRQIMDTLFWNSEWQKAVREGAANNRHIVIDTRTNMLMKGMYPSIPGWHCDDVPRNEKYAQPDLSKVTPDIQHFMVILSDNDTCPTRTQFVTEPAMIDVDAANVWSSVDAAVEREKFRTSFLSEGEIIRFSQTAIHRASLCSTPGWRIFFRASVTHREPVNEIRRQVQVYATAGYPQAVASGW